MAEKKWYQSKAIWGAVLVFMAGGLSALGYTELGNILLTLGGGIGIVGLRLAESKIA